MMNHPILIANWKMHKGEREALAFIERLSELRDLPKCWIGIAPAFPFILSCAKAAPSGIHIGAQNMNEHAHGAFTGEVSGPMLKEAGAAFVLIGHSERRALFHESEAVIHKKLKEALHIGLLPVLCIGETLSERESGQTESVVRRQLTSALEGLTLSAPFILAYEPVWAIGTGRVATPEMAQETHAFCRQVLVELLGSDLAKKTPILYGGSVKADNAASLLAQPDINGALIGGASLDVDSFIKIIYNR